MGGKGAARLGDAHECQKKDPQPPMSVGTWPCKEVVTPDPKQHVGQPVMPACSPNVKVEGKPAARCGDLVACIGSPAVDLIVTGSKTVKINGVLAAFIGSRCFHDGTITSGSTKVFYDEVMDGATFGDPAAATAACEEAARSRRKYQAGMQQWVDSQNNPDLSEDYAKDPEGALKRYAEKTGQKPPAPDKSQGYQNNCGQETARQICIEKCKKGNQKACAACSKTEEQWYQEYLTKQKDDHNKVNEKARQAAEKRNDDKWQRVVEAGTFTHGKNYKEDPSTHGGWRTFKSLPYVVEIPGIPVKEKIVFEKPPSEIKDSDLNNPNSSIGSFDETRTKMLKEQCDIDSFPGGNDTPYIGHDIAQGKTVVASVDVDVLHGRKDEQNGAPALHAVTVSQMQFNPDGTLKQVTMNDTAAKDGCGKVYTGAQFQNALVTQQGGQGTLTNVVP